MSCPLLLSFLLRAIKPWDKDAMITTLTEESPFGIAFNLLDFKHGICMLVFYDHWGMADIYAFMDPIEIATTFGRRPA